MERRNWYTVERGNWHTVERGNWHTVEEGNMVWPLVKEFCRQFHFALGVAYPIKTRG